jgi:bifunctional DNA-binding transcriptional regulator/antitoxin component of YhaV-PrlF toxin-antitoxin module
MTGNIVIVQELQHGQLIISIPKAIASFKGWKKGTKLKILEYKGDVVLKEVVK